MTQNTGLDFADLLDDDLDIADLAELNTTLHAGTHRVSINWSVKPIKDVPYFELTMTLLETRELAGDDAGKEFQKPGLKCNVLFNKDGGMGEGKLRAVLESLSEAAGTTKAKAIMEATQGFECVVATGKRKAVKDGEEKIYFDLKTIMPV